MDKKINYLENRLKDAERLLSECNLLLKLMAAVNHRPMTGDPLRDGIDDFLSSSPFATVRTPSVLVSGDEGTP